jgi:hypothetical protein
MAHAGRGPSDGDLNAARGSVRVLTSATHAEQLQADRAQASLHHAHPLALLYRYDADADASAGDEVALSGHSDAGSDIDMQGSPSASSNNGIWAPMAEPLPQGVHLFGLGAWLPLPRPFPFYIIRGLSFTPLPPPPPPQAVARSLPEAGTYRITSTRTRSRASSGCR